MDKRQIWYEPHPVSAERKAELRAQGYVIVDVIFAPEDHVQPDSESKAAVKTELKVKPARGKGISPAETDEGK